MNPFQEAEKIYREFLKKNKMFYTKERETLLSCLYEQEHHFSADDLMFSIQKDGKKVSRATLYRNLAHLVEAGVLSEAPDFGHGHSHYEVLIGKEPHLHLISSQTEQIKEVYHSNLVKLLEKIAEEEGFEMSRYKLQIFGHFKEGSKAKSKAKKGNKKA